MSPRPLHPVTPTATASLALVALLAAASLLQPVAAFGGFGSFDPFGHLMAPQLRHRRPAFPQAPPAPQRHEVVCANSQAPLHSTQFNVEEHTETGGWLIWAQMPGVVPQNVRVHRDVGMLTVEAARAVPRGCERFTPRGDSVRKQFQIPRDTPLNRVSAELVDGKLKVLVPAGASRLAQLRQQQLEAQQKEQPPQSTPPPPPKRPSTPKRQRSLAQLEKALREAAASLSELISDPETECPTERLDDAADEPEDAASAAAETSVEPEWFHTAVLIVSGADKPAEQPQDEGVIVLS